MVFFWWQLVADTKTPPICRTPFWVKGFHSGPGPSTPLSSRFLAMAEPGEMVDGVGAISIAPDVFWLTQRLKTGSSSTFIALPHSNHVFGVGKIGYLDRGQ